MDVATTAERVAEGREQILAELRKVIIGQDEVVEEVLIALFTGGHCLITGVPGQAKTLLIKTLAGILDLDFKRIQFTPEMAEDDPRRVAFGRRHKRAEAWLRASVMAALLALVLS